MEGMEVRRKMGALLEVKNMSVDFTTDQGIVHAVRDVSFQVGEKEVLGIVGESGSGKSQTMYSVMGLLARNGHMCEGEIYFNGHDLTRSHFKERQDYRKMMWDLRGNEISMIFQDPMTFLNPVLTIGKQLMEPLLNHTKMSKAQARAKAIELMGQVGIPSPEKRLGQYPHEFSGGMRQRIIIAIALACSPKLIIADEPTTALDVTIQAQILQLIRSINREYGMSMILITHNMGIVAQMCNRVMVMYGGVCVEEGPTDKIFESPKHPYTRGLLKAIPSIASDKEELFSIPGTVPHFSFPVERCRFADRCPYSTDECISHEPELTCYAEDCSVRCFRAIKEEIL